MYPRGSASHSRLGEPHFVCHLIAALSGRFLVGKKNILPPIIQNQMDNNMENEMETEIIYGVMSYNLHFRSLDYSL